MKPAAELLKLTGKAAIVTGGASGIGKGIALRLGEAGAGVIVSDINIEGARQTVAEIEALGGRARAVYADAPDITAAQKTVDLALEIFGRLDILVNVVGIRLFSSFAHVTEDAWDRMLDANLKSMFFTSQAAAKAMIKGGQGGKIVNISSVGAVRPHGYCAHYDASKAGVVGLTQALALELAPYHIQVNAIAPGGTMTPGAIEAGKGIQACRDQFEHPVLNVWSLDVPWFRFAEPDDIAKVALFLASEAADYMTGCLLVVDGGRTLL